MKTIRFIAVIALMMMGGMTMKAQDYHPIVEEGKQWNVLFSYPWNPPEPQHKYTDIYKIEGDTLLDGVSYKVMYTTRNEDLTGWSVCGVIRETEDKQVLYRRDGSSYDEILYDFSMEVGDTIIMSGSGFYPDWMFVIETNEILVNGEPRQQIVLEYPFGNGEEEVWIEGIGSLYGIVDSGSLFLTGGSTNLLCYYEDGDLIWQNTTPGYNECYMVYPTPPTPPEPHSFAPQGAEWYFNLSSFMGSPISYYHMEVLGDTIIQGHICSVITQQFLGGNGQEQYVYEDNGKVYWYNQTLGRFTTLYDFDAEVGESWTCEIDSCTYEVTVTEITYYEGLDQNHQFRAQRVSYNGELGYFGGGTIIDGIGEISGLFPYPYACVGDIYDGPYPDWLRCYLVDGEMLYHGGDYECDEIVDVPYPSYPFAVGDLLYTIISDNPPQVSVYGHVNGENAQGELIIPETVNYEGVTYTVTKIGYEAFYQCSGLTGNLVIPSTVDTIMTRAFKNCSGFTGDLVIPNSVRHLGGGAFEWCYGFDGTLVLPEAIPAIYSYTFQGCTGLTGTLNIPSTVTSIGPAAFGLCTGFTGTLVIPESVVELSTPVPPVNGIRGAFEECSGFTGLVLPESLRIIGGGSGGGCFAYCTGLTGELVIPNKVKVIGHSAFYNCTGLTGELHLPDSLQSIGYEAFALCSGLTGRLVFPDALETIDNEAFAGCSGFSDVDLHHQVFYQNNFGNAVFAYWSMESLELPEGWTTTGKYTFKGCGNLRTVHLPESLTFVDGSSFSECTSLSEINIPEGVTEIGIGAFSKCSSLTHVELPASLRTLGGQAFADCTSLSGILVVPDLVQRIEMMTFRSCNQLDCIVLGDSINYIAEPAFQDTELDSLVIKAMTPPELRRMTTQGAWHFPDDLSIVVPCGTLEAYQNSEDWADFTNITENCDGGLIEFQGSEWYYEIQNENGSITYQHLEYVADTTINHKDVKIIIRTNTLYDKGEHNEVTREYVYREDQLVYWWNKDLQEFTVLYDLGAQEGDSWVIKVGTETLTMHVDAVGYNYYGGQLFKMLYVSDDQDLFSGTIVSGVGHLSSFFPERLMTRGRGYGVNGLRCYWRFGNLLFTVNRGDCDAIYAELHIGLDEPTAIPFAIYPNPTDGILTIHHSEFNIPHSSFRITNLMGQTVLTGSLTAETQQIDVSGLPQGMYFISVGDMTRKFVVR